MEQNSSVDHVAIAAQVVDICLAREVYQRESAIAERKRFDNALNHEAFIQTNAAIAAYLGAPKRHIVSAVLANLLGKLKADTSATERLAELQRLPICSESFEARLSALAQFVQQYLPSAAREVVPELGTVCISMARRNS